MKIVMSKKKRYLLLLLVLLVLAGVTSGIYIFVNSKTEVSYNVDKYSDPAGWCDTNVTDNVLHAECKGLLLDITSPEDGSSCFEVQIITKDKELKDITICEKGDTLTYTNEILEYKKLMPIGIVFTYNQKWILNDYSFSNVSFTKLDDTYVQGVVNEDIANLVTIDPSSTTIENSVDFCPRPETLPDYVTEANRVAYTEYFNKNIMAKEKYNDGYYYNIDDTVIRLLFGCDSQKTAGYIQSCPESKIEITDTIKTELAKTPNIPVWGKTIDVNEKYLMKEISLLYDDNSLINLSDKSKYLFAILEKLNSYGEMSEEIYCASYKLLTKMNDTNVTIYAEQIESYLVTNLAEITSPICVDAISEENINFSGLYTKLVFAKQQTGLEIFDKCKLLNLELQQKHD